MSNFVRHPIPPVWDHTSKILILGSMPSPKSREAGFFYAHPQQRFWNVLSAVLNDPVPDEIPARRAWLLSHHIALWDVLASCTISGASDSSIKDAVANDLSPILSGASIRAIFTTGGAAQTYYTRLIQPKTGIPATRLPSTSPANCAVSLEQLIDAYRIINDYL